jgi:CHAD domain-containing protein
VSSHRTLERAETIAAQPWIERLIESAEIARAGHDGEGVHQVRASAGRLDVWLRMGERRVLRDDLRWVRSAAADVRDFDVLLERTLPPVFAAWVHSERVVARTRMLRTLDDPRFVALTSSLALLPNVEPAQGVAYAKRERRKVEERGRAIEREDAGIGDMHRLRRCVRRLRYAREALGIGARRVKALQDDLGRLNDAAVALAHVDHCPHAGELGDLRAQLGDEVRQAFEDAQAAWRETDLDRVENRE